MHRKSERAAIYKRTLYHCSLHNLNGRSERTTGAGASANDHSEDAPGWPGMKACQQLLHLRSMLRNRWAWRADLNRCILRSRRRTG